jgi:hypothetical protein
MAHLDVTGLTRCYDLISMLQAELRTAKQLREQLETPVRPSEHAERVHELCTELVAKAAETAHTARTLRDEVCASLDKADLNPHLTLRGRRGNVTR